MDIRSKERGDGGRTVPTTVGMTTMMFLDADGMIAKDGMKIGGFIQEHSVILTPFEVAVDGVQIPDRRYRYTWRSEVPTSHCRCTRTTMPQSA